MSAEEARRYRLVDETAGGIRVIKQGQGPRLVVGARKPKP